MTDTKYCFGPPVCCGEKMDRNDSETRGYPDEYQCRECGETTTRNEYENREQSKAERAHERAYSTDGLSFRESVERQAQIQSELKR